MNAYAKILLQDQRLVTLRVLADAPGYSANESVMVSSLEIWGHQISRDVIAGIFDWLEEAGLVTLETISQTIRIAKLTERGQDVAEGRAKHSGVKRPRAGQ